MYSVGQQLLPPVLCSEPHPAGIAVVDLLAVVDQLAVVDLLVRMTLEWEASRSSKCAFVSGSCPQMSPARRRGLPINPCHCLWAQYPSSTEPARVRLVLRVKRSRAPEMYTSE